MSKKVIVTDWCDIPDQEGDHPAYRTVRFGVDSKAYEADLCDGHAHRLELSLAPFIDAARPAGRAVKAARHRPTSARRRSAAVRAWARQQGLPVGEVGRIPDGVVARYEAAQKAASRA